ncbi:MAG: S41 family peptidase [Anaerolineaceae bacterium]|nr:S41 family peptidase [Anaerolineaceae bacterium]
MNLKTIRIVAGIVLIVCIFITGVSAGVIIQSLGDIQQTAEDLRDYTRSADFMLAAAGEKTSESEEVDNLFAPFWESWDLLHLYFVDQPLDENAMMEGAIRGMISALGDPHTRYANPDEYQAEVESAAGNYQGIGAYVDVTGEYVKINSTMSGSPAEEAGLLPGDLVIALNGKDVTGIDPNVVLQDIRGPEGTSVTLTIRRGEDEPFDVDIVRRRIETASVEGKMLEDGIAYISMDQFGDKTTQELRNALDELMKNNPKGLIFDLRDNGGGWLTTAIETASEFLPLNTTVLIEKDGDGKETIYKTERGGGRALDIPMVVLINENSASASEIVTGALLVHDRATIIGKTSYGKGSVQIQPSLSNGGAVSVTIARWYMPDGTLIHGVGIKPDIEVDYTREDFENGVDPQLDAAIAFLNGTLPQSNESKPEE